MAATPASASIAVTVRLPADLVARLDALGEATERTRSYWIQAAIEEIVERELWQVHDVEEALAAADADPDEGMTADAFAAWMIEQSLTTRDALDRAAARRRQ
jgi:predicted transcriptional regulator